MKANPVRGKVQDVGSIPTASTTFHLNIERSVPTEHKLKSEEGKLYNVGVYCFQDGQSLEPLSGSSSLHTSGGGSLSAVI